MIEMSIKGRFIKGIIGRIVHRAIKKKTGKNVDVRIEDFEIDTFDDGMVGIHIDITGIISKEDLTALIKEVGI